MPIYLPADIMGDMEQDTKLSFQFTAEDMEIMEQGRRLLAASLGTVSNIAVIRWALRKAIQKPKVRTRT